jgi:ribonuclease HI
MAARTIAHWNCRGLEFKITELLPWLAKHDPDILIINEAKFARGRKIIVGKYIVHYVLGKKEQWGTVVLSKRDLTRNIIYQSSAVDDFETVMFNMIISGTTFTVVGTYWPPKYEPEFTAWRTLLGRGAAPYLWVGDFNAHHKGLLNSTHTDNKGKVMAKLADEFDLVLKLDGPTRFQENQTPSVLDLALISANWAQRSTRITSIDRYKSDHVLWRLEIDTKKRKVKKMMPDWKKFSREASDRVAVALGGEELESISEVAASLTSSLQGALQASLVEVVEIQKPGEVHWWNPDCKKAKKAAKAAARKTTQPRVTKEDWKAYREMQAQARRVLRAQKKAARVNFTERVSKMKSSYYAWRFLNGCKPLAALPKAAEVFQLAGKSRPEVQREVTDFFTDIYSPVDIGGPGTAETEEEMADKEKELKAPPESMARPFTLKELRHALRNMSNTTPGEDKITVKMLRVLPEEEKVKLLTVLNQSWITRKVPRAWKCGKIILIPKAGKDPENIKNWRPICLTSVLSKVLEKMINRRLVWWLESSDFYGDDQQGFRWHRSTQDAVGELAGVIKEALQSGDTVAALHVDIESAFTSVNIPCLLEDLAQLRLPQQVLDWLTDYLTERTVTVVLGTDQQTSAIPLGRGLIQGSTLSPTLWNIHARGLLRRVRKRGTVSSFADDVTLSARCKTPTEALQQVEELAEIFAIECERRGLKASVAKYQLVLHTQRQILPTHWNISGHRLPIQKEGKILGVTLDKELRGTEYSKEVSEQCQARLQVVRAARGIAVGISNHHMLNLCRGFVGSKLDFGAVPFHHMEGKNSERLDKVETQGLRICLAALSGTSNAALYAEAGVLPRELRWEAIVTKLWATRRRHGRGGLGGWKDDRQYKNHANRLGPAGKCEKKREAIITALFEGTERAGWGEEAVPFWEEEDLIQEGPKVRLYGKKSDLPEAVLKQATLEALMETRETDCLIYTDGSKMGEKGGGAFAVPSEGKEESFQTEWWASVMTTEMIAIAEALEWARMNVEGGRRVVILTDSRSAFEQVLQGDHKSENLPERRSIFQAARDIQQNGGSVLISWIPSHCGLEGNEAADRLAKAGAQGAGRIVKSVPTKKEVRNLLHEAMLEEHQQQWDAGKSGRWRYEVQPKLEKRVNWQLTRKDDVLMTRLRLGKARLAEWRKQILRRGNGICPDCRRGAENLHHLMVTCSRWARARRRMWERLKVPVGKRTLKLLLGSSETKAGTVRDRVRALREFLRETGKLTWVSLAG